MHTVHLRLDEPSLGRSGALTSYSAKRSTIAHIVWSRRISFTGRSPPKIRAHRLLTGNDAAPMDEGAGTMPCTNTR
jgi:hypothetical protein